MASLTQQINSNPSLIFSTPTSELRDELAKQPTLELKIFLNTIGNAEWLLTLKKDQHLDLAKKIQLILPAHVITSKFQEFDFLTTALGPYLPKEPPKDFLQQLYRENRPFCYAMSTCNKNIELNDKPADDDPTKTLQIFHSLHQHQPEIVEFLLDEDISLTAKVEGDDLLDMGKSYKLATPLFAKILEAYRRRLPADEYKALLEARAPALLANFAHGSTEKLVILFTACRQVGLTNIEFPINNTSDQPSFPWAKTPETWSILFRVLSDKTKREILQNYPFYFVTQFGMADNLEYLREMFITLKAMGIGHQSFSRNRKGRHLTYMENFFLMLGRREAARALFVETSPEAEVKISKTDSLYKSFDSGKTFSSLALKREKLMDTLRFRKGDVTIWDDRVFLKKAHQFMKEAFLATVFLFRDAWENSGHDAKEMGKLLEDQSQGRSSYIGRYFYGSFVEFYRLSLGKAVFSQNGDFMLFPELTSKDEDPYFDPSQYQYHWRVMYTAIRSLLDYYPFDADQFDTRYLSWTPWHLDREINGDERKPLTIYGTRPTL